MREGSVAHACSCQGGAGEGWGSVGGAEGLSAEEEERLEARDMKQCSPLHGRVSQGGPRLAFCQRGGAGVSRWGKKGVDEAVAESRFRSAIFTR